MELFDYLDYREYLRDFFEEQKKKHLYWSYRYVGKKLGMDAGYFVRILQGKYHLSKAKIPKVIELCKFDEKQSEYFNTLVHFNKSKNEKDTKLFFEQLLSFKDVKLLQIRSHQYEYYKQWYHAAIRNIIDEGYFNGDFQYLAESLSPVITIREAKKSVQLLKKLGLIYIDKGGVYKVSDKHVTTGKEFQSLAVRNYQKLTMDLAKESLERHSKKLRDITTLTLSLNSEALEDIRDMAREFRRSIQKRVEEIPNSERIYQMNIQLFPLSQNLKGGKK